jgi:[acyl-carrier-protein] S-malonyltransferase
MKPFAFLFPGQGSQSVGMLDGWNNHPVVQQTLQEASDALGEDLAQLIHNGPKEVLGLTTNTQPVMLVAGLAAYRVWMAEVGIPPNVVAGHSLGEYSALVATGVLTLAQAAPLVRLRAQAMQEAVPVGMGAMAAVLGLEATRITAICQEVRQSFPAQSNEVVEVANFNEPGQTVISGSKAAIEKACETLKSSGAKRTLPLPVSAPFHSSLMLPAAQKLKQALDTLVFMQPQIPLVNNIDVAVENDTDRIKNALYRQAYGPVRWVECVQEIKAQGIGHFVECGPGKVLTGMLKRIDAELVASVLFDPATMADTQGALT